MDEEIIAGLKNGSEVAFRQAIKQYQDNLKRYLRSKLDSPGDVDDIVHDTFVEFWIQFVQKQREITNLKALLFRIAHNRAVDRIRRSRLQSLFMRHENKKSDLESPLYNSTQKEMDTSLLKIFLQLPSKDREMLELFYIEELKMNEIAQVLCIGEEAVSSRLRRARTRLKNLLPESFYQEWRETHDLSEVRL